MVQDGPDPCAGCKLRMRLESAGGFQAAYYAAFLHTYLKAFRLSPRQLSWRDFEIYQVYLTARAEREYEEARKYWKNRREVNKII